MPLPRPHRAEDIPALVALMQGMQAHYRVPCPPAAEIAAALADLPPGTGILVAGEPPLGFAAWSLHWPGPGLNRGLYLKELFVAAPARGQGHGRALMAGLARIAIENRCARIDFTAAAADVRLLAFYASCGATPLTDRHFHRLAGQALTALARH